MIFTIALMTAALAPQSNVTPASKANIDAFMAVLPPSQSNHDALDDTEVEAQDKLSKLNPGKEAMVREIMAAHRSCMKPVEKNAVDRELRQTAWSLGDDRLRLMTEFYRKGEQKSLDPLLAKRKAGTMTSAEATELKRLLDTYPLLDYREATKATQQDMFNDEQLINGMQSCDDQTEKAVMAAGLKYE